MSVPSRGRLVKASVPDLTYIEETVGEAPEEEERDDQTERVDQFLAGEVTPSNARGICGHATACHCSEWVVMLSWGSGIVMSMVVARSG